MTTPTAADLIAQLQAGIAALGDPTGALAAAIKALTPKPPPASTGADVAIGKPNQVRINK